MTDDIEGPILTATEIEKQSELLEKEFGKKLEILREKIFTENPLLSAAIGLSFLIKKANKNEQLTENEQETFNQLFEILKKGESK